MGIWKPTRLGVSVSASLTYLHEDYYQALPDWTQEDVIGSPYAVRDYDINPNLGDWNELDQVREKLHKLGIGVVLDFVPNHTALDHKWVKDHPQYYIQTTAEIAAQMKDDYFPVNLGDEEFYIAHGRDPYFPPWTDTAQLNYFNPETREALLFTLSEIASHCDGLRCDMAMLTLNDIFASTWKIQLEQGGWTYPDCEFWDAVINDVKKDFPDFIFIAEVYWEREQQLQGLGFDFTYDKKLYDMLKADHASEINMYLQTERMSSKWTRFVENHDEPRVVAEFGYIKTPAAATLTATLPGMRLLHQGQLEGRSHKLPVQLARAYEEPVHKGLLAYYEKILGLLNQDVLHSGNWQKLTAQSVGKLNHLDIIAYQWEKDGQRIIFVINYSAHDSQANIGLPDINNQKEEIKFLEKLSEKEFVYKTQDIITHGLYVDLKPWQVQVFEMK